MYSDIFSNILSGILSGISCAVYLVACILTFYWQFFLAPLHLLSLAFLVACILTFVLIFSGILSGIFCLYFIWQLFLACILTFVWHTFLHSIWHLLWHSLWHSTWHLRWYCSGIYIWHLLWQSLCDRVWIFDILWHESFWQVFRHSFLHVFGSVCSQPDLVLAIPFEPCAGAPLYGFGSTWWMWRVALWISEWPWNLPRHDNLVGGVKHFLIFLLSLGELHLIFFGWVETRWQYGMAWSSDKKQM